MKIVLIQSWTQIGTYSYKIVYKIHKYYPDKLHGQADYGKILAEVWRQRCNGTKMGTLYLNLAQSSRWQNNTGYILTLT